MLYVLFVCILVLNSIVNEEKIIRIARLLPLSYYNEDETKARKDHHFVHVRDLVSWEAVRTGPQVSVFNFTAYLSMVPRTSFCKQCLLIASTKPTISALQENVNRHSLYNYSE